MPAVADRPRRRARVVPAAANDNARGEHDRALRALAEELRAALPRVPSGYRPGRSALVEAVARLARAPAPAASRMLTGMIELGLVKYDAGGRGIGAAGVWTYPRSASVRPKTPVRRRR